MNRRARWLLWILAWGCSASHPSAESARQQVPRETVWLDVSSDAMNGRRPHFVPTATGSFVAYLRGSAARVHADGVELTVALEHGEAALRLGPSEMRREGWVAPTGSLRVEVDGSVTRGSESVRAGTHVLEQRWHLLEPPPGLGDLVVTVPTRAELVRSDQDGLYLRTDSSGMIFRYGHATWIDRRGDEVAVPARREADGIVLRVPAHVVDTATYPVVLDPVIGPEVPVDPAIYPSTTGGSGTRGVAWDGSQYLVVWRDAGQDLVPPLPHIRANRVSAGGAVLDGAGFQVAEGSFPGVGSSGTEFLVAYRAPGPPTMSDLRIRRVSSSGTPLGTEVTLGVCPESLPVVVFGDGVYLVAWESCDSSARYQVARVDASGVVLDDPPLVLGVPTDVGSPVAATFVGGRFVISWTRFSTRSTVAVRVTPTGVVEDPVPVTIVPDGVNSAAPLGLASDGTDLLFVVPRQIGWADAVRVRSDLTVLDTAEHVAFGSRGARVGWNGTAYVTTTIGPGDALRVVSIDTSTIPMTVGPSELLPPTTPIDQSSLSSGGNPLLMVFTDNGIRARRHDRAVGLLDDPPLVIDQAANSQIRAEVAATARQFLVAWVDHRMDRADIQFARVAPTGRVLDSSPILLASDVGSSSNVLHGVLAHGSEFLVMFRTPTSGFRIQRVSAAGSLLGEPYALPPTGVALEAVASDGTSVLVVGTRVGSTMSGTYAYRMDETGATLDPAPILLTTSLGTGVRVAVADRMFFVGMRLNNHLRVSRITGTGTLIDPIPLSAHAASPSSDQFDMASDGTDMVFVWTTLPAPSRHNLRAARFTAGGLSPDAMSAPTLDDRDELGYVRLAFDGTEYIASYLHALSSSDATWFAPDLTVEVGSPHINVPGSGSGSPIHCQIAALPTGQTLFAYSARQPPPVRNARLHLRIASRGSPLGTPCTTESECGSGYCVDGFCCDSACGAGVYDCQTCATSEGAAADGVCTLVAAGVECRPAASLCDAMEVCDGVRAACPTDVNQPDGTACGDGIVCNGAEQCWGGTCVASPLDCDDGDPCTRDSCREPGECVHEPIVGCCRADAACDDGTVCTRDACVAGTCVHELAVGCCVTGAECDDADPCTADACIANACRHEVVRGDPACEGGRPADGCQCGVRSAGPPFRLEWLLLAWLGVRRRTWCVRR